MARLGIKDAFAKYGAKLHNVNWSVSAWASDGSLVVSLWAHHYRKGPSGTAEYADSFARWSGAGNSEFRKNVTCAFSERSKIRLVVVSTLDTKHVQAGEDASSLKKDFDAKEELVGEVAELDGENYVFRFSRVIAG
jgi:hypothetical protein